MTARVRASDIRTEIFMKRFEKKPSLNTDTVSDLDANALKSSAQIKVAKATVLAVSIGLISADAKKEFPERSDARKPVATLMKRTTAWIPMRVLILAFTIV